MTEVISEKCLKNKRLQPTCFHLLICFIHKYFFLYIFKIIIISSNISSTSSMQLFEILKRPFLAYFLHCSQMRHAYARRSRIWLVRRLTPLRLLSGPSSSLEATSMETAGEVSTVHKDRVRNIWKNKQSFRLCISRKVALKFKFIVNLASSVS